MKTAGFGKSVATLYNICTERTQVNLCTNTRICTAPHNSGIAINRTLCTSSSVRFLSDCSWWGCRGPDRRVLLSPSNLIWMPAIDVSVGKLTMTFPVMKSRLVKWPWGLFNWIVADMVTALESPIGSGHTVQEPLVDPGVVVTGGCGFRPYRSSMDVCSFPVSNGIAISNNESREWSLYLKNNWREKARKKEMTSGREKEKNFGLWGRFS